MGLETIKLDIQSKVLSRTKLAECVSKRIECANYWNSHGRKVWYDPTAYDYDEPKKVELFEKVIEHTYPDASKYEFTVWELFVGGERLEGLGEIMRFKPFKTKIKLQCCVGCG